MRDMPPVIEDIPSVRLLYLFQTMDLRVSDLHSEAYDAYFEMGSELIRRGQRHIKIKPEAIQ